MNNEKGITELKADVLVIGGGGAGVAAAAAAAEKGSKVILLEKRGLGGSSALAFGIFAAESPLQQKAGVICTRDECFKIAMEWARWRINPRVVRAFIDRSGDTIQWLMEKGVEFETEMFRPRQFSTVHQIKGRGFALIKALADSCRQHGGEIFIHTVAKKILISQEKRVEGVLAEKEGQLLFINTPTVVIATGGFAGNKTLLKQYCPDYHDNMEIIGIPNAGDGILMAMESGAALEGMGNLLLGMPRALHPPYDEPEDTDIPPSLRRMGLIIFASDPRTLRINKWGKRFVDESVGMGENAIVRQPDNVCYSIFDSNLLIIYSEEGTSGPMGTAGENKKISFSEWEQFLIAKEKKGIIKRCNSISELAFWAGISPSKLQETIEEYNQFCQKGYDPVFAKDARYLVPLNNSPYYIIRWAASCLNTMGGIKINENTEVIDVNGYPIPGLYAAGVDTGGSWESPTYCMKISGHAFGFSVISGRIAGEKAAEYAST